MVVATNLKRNEPLDIFRRDDSNFKRNPALDRNMLSRYSGLTSGPPTTSGPSSSGYTASSTTTQNNTGSAGSAGGQITGYKDSKGNDIRITPTASQGQLITVNGKKMPLSTALRDGLISPAYAPKVLSAKEKGIEAMEEAKQKQEAGKQSALSYYDTAMKNVENLNKNSLGLYQNVSQNIEAMNPELITSEDQRRMLANRKASLSASGQNLTGMFTDADSGVQTGRRLGIARGVASESAMLPISTEMEVKGLNRQSALNLLDRKTNLAGSMTNTNQSLASAYLSAASGKAGVETAYQYDGGAEYLNQLGEATGKSMGTPSSIKVNMRPKSNDKSDGISGTAGGGKRPGHGDGITTTSGGSGFGATAGVGVGAGGGTVLNPSQTSGLQRPNLGTRLYRPLTTTSKPPLWSTLNTASQSSFKRRR